MYHNAALTDEEFAVVDRLKELFCPLASLDLNNALIDRPIPGEWLLLISNTVFDKNKVERAYDVDAVAQDDNGLPLGIAMFHKQGLLLSKLHIFRFDGVGEIKVNVQSIRVDFAETQQ